MSVDTNIKIGADTSQVDSLIKAMESLGFSISNLTSVSDDLKKTKEALAQKIRSLGDAQTKAADDTDKASKVLARQKSILEGMTRGFSSGEAGILATAKAAGIAANDLKQLENTLKQIRQLKGGDPFDESTGALRRLSEQITVNKRVLQELGTQSGITARQSEELLRAETALEIKMKAAGVSSRERKSALFNLRKEFRELAVEQNSLIAEIDAYEKKQREAKKAEEDRKNAMEGLALGIKRVNDAQRNIETNFFDRTKEQIRTFGKQTIETTNEVFRLRKQLEALGKSEAFIDKKVRDFVKLRRELDNVKLAALQANRAMTGISSLARSIAPAIGAIGAGAIFLSLGKAALEAADNMALLRTRLAFVTPATESLDGVMQRLVNTSNDNRSNIQDTVTLYNRLEPVMLRLGKTTDDTLKVTDAFQKTLLLSGANTREASAAILQFSQAMASGKLAGDEFRSISEAAPEFLRAFSDATGIASSKLKALSADGKLTTEVVSDALLIMRDKLILASASIEANFSQSLQILKNNLTVAIDEINRATGFTKFLAETTLDLAEAVKSGSTGILDFAANNKGLISSVGALATGLTVILGSFLAIKGAVALASGVTAVYTGVLATLKIITNAVAAQTIAATLGFGKMSLAVGFLTGSLKLLRAALVTTGVGALVVGLGFLAQSFFDVEDSATKAQDAISKREARLNSELANNEERLRRLEGEFQTRVRLLGDEKKALDQSRIGNITWGQSLEEARQKVKVSEDALFDFINAQFGVLEMTRKDTDAIRALRESVEDLPPALAAYKEELDKLINKEKERALSLQAQAMGQDEMVFKARLLVAELEKQDAENKKLTDSEREKNAEVRAGILAAAGLAAGLKASNDSMSGILKSTEDYESKAKALNEEIDKRILTEDQYMKKQLQVLEVSQLKVLAEADLLLSAQNLTAAEQARAIALESQALSMQKYIDAINRSIANPKPSGGSGGAKKEDPQKQIIEDLKKENAEIALRLLLGEELSESQKKELEVRQKLGNKINAVTIALLEDNKALMDQEKTMTEALEARKNLNDSVAESINSISDEIREIKKQTEEIGLEKDELRALELSRLDSNIALKEEALAREQATGKNRETIELLRGEIAAMKELRDAKKGLFDRQNEQDILEQIKKIAEETSKEFEKIQDDIAKSITDAIAAGGQNGKEILKNMFKAQVFRIFIEPVVKQLTGDVLGGIFGKNPSTGQSSVFGSFGSGGSTSIFSNGGLGGGFSTDAGIASQGFLDLGNTIANTFGDSAFTDAIINNSEMLGKVSAGLGLVTTGLGVFDSLKQGKYGSAVGEGLGYYFGGSIGGSIGKALGGFVDKIFGFGGKISATSLPASFGNELREALQKQYTDAVSSLGGALDNSVTFGAGGNTGRQGQNPNFTISASASGRSIFNSANTREGQADGLFLSGEVALNEANLADQSLRALFETLKRTDFDDNIDAIIAKVNTFSDSFETLQTTLADAQLLRMINVEFPKFGGSLATLANQNIEVIKTFIALAGGFENLATLQNQYVESIFSDQEKLNIQSENLGKAFEALNIEFPRTAQQYRELVDAQDLTTFAGQQMYISLLQLAPAFKQIITPIEQAKIALDDFLSSITGTSGSALQRLSSEIAELFNSRNGADNDAERLSFETSLSEKIKQRYELELELLGSVSDRIKSTLESVVNEREALSEARNRILGIGQEFNAQAIADRIAAVSVTGAPSDERLLKNTADLQLTETLLGFARSANDLERIAELEGQLVERAKAKAAAEEEFARRTTEFLASNELSIGKLSALRQDVVDFYDAQKQAVEESLSVAKNLRETISGLGRSSQVTQSVFDTLKAQFDKAVFFARSGVNVTAQAQTINDILPSLIENLNLTSANALDFERQRAIILAQSLGVAEKVESSVDMNFESESIALLDSIDLQLARLQQGVMDADMLVVAAIERNKEATLNALRQISNSLTGQTVTPFATGAAFTNSVVSRPTFFNSSVMGEAGPEGILPLANVNGSLGVRALTDSGDSTARAISGLARRLDNLSAEVRAVAQHTNKSAKYLERWDDGDSLAVRVINEEPIATTQEN